MPSTMSGAALGVGGTAIERHSRQLASQRALYTLICVGLLLFVVSGSLWFANETNSGKFFDRLPHLFDFVQDLAPRDGSEVWRALFDLPSPYDDGSFKYNYPEGRVYLTESFYIPEYFAKMIETLNIALVSTLIGLILGFGLCFLAAKNTTPSRWIRVPVRRLMEVLRAFPEVVIAGFCLAILSLGPIPAVIAVSIHTIGALGKMFYEVVENADMRPDEGLRSVGANWVERMWVGFVPQVMPNFMSYFLLRFEINVRASTIIGAVGGGGIGELLRLSIGQGHQAKTLAIILLLLLTIIGIDQFSAWLRRKLIGEQSFSSI
ncbi:phosphonate ABC transporter, permease protein PhnE [Rhizobium laguerreae]|uniref:phosphonate ABC transporter, permease protein PhnE n=2 Tax=Rhizobium laguerreae TaxID=1076926 RepID=UPI001C907974|nr:phosphonate ABC transporter, permease protein PhnE [Rhizobium laguerreae]MBY3246134.1 phosphonate ABC transporter, permease protein PhnE [Rhizobium laguerreae]MBY3252787.1 phosphonate ABC transporter, permease protein PhnE [Rhizobium laguerreae]